MLVGGSVGLGGDFVEVVSAWFGTGITLFHRTPPLAGAQGRGGVARTVVLTAKEFVLLEFLARRSGQAVSKTVISQGVWDRDYDGRSNLLEVFIARLRQKLADAGAPRIIETVKGTGYRINPEFR